MIRYEQDKQWKKIIAFAAFIAVLIAAMVLALGDRSYNSKNENNKTR